MPVERVLPLAWLPYPLTSPRRIDRIVVHWSAGGYTVSAEDKSCYHAIIGGDGLAVKGNTPTGSRAAHTRNLNTGSYGLSMACMAGAVERPFSAGRYPLKSLQ